LRNGTARLILSGNLPAGYINFSIIIKLAQSKVKFITRSKTNLAYKPERTIVPQHMITLKRAG
jgi:hypothetical protein